MIFIIYETRKICTNNEKVMLKISKLSKTSLKAFILMLFVLMLCLTSQEIFGFVVESSHGRWHVKPNAFVEEVLSRYPVTIFSFSKNIFDVSKRYVDYLTGTILKRKVRPLNKNSISIFVRTSIVLSNLSVLFFDLPEGAAAS